MWESESDAGERGLVPVLGGSDRHDPLKTDGFVRRDQSWYVGSFSIQCASCLIYLLKLKNQIWRFSCMQFTLIVEIGRASDRERVSSYV